MQESGIDLSKEKFDVNFIDEKGKEKNQEVKNAVASISKFLSSVSGNSILCAEYTGKHGYTIFVKANDIFRVPPQLDVTICDFKISNSS